jgi:cephalosporin-C deacetylase-like acetyl esterase
MRRLSLLFAAALLASLALAADDAETKALADKLRGLDATVLATDADKAKDLQGMVSRDLRQRFHDANLRDVDAWRAVKSKADWERFRDARLEALRASLGSYPTPPEKVPVRVVRTLKADGYEIDDILFESRPGLWVSANLYRPAKLGKSMPGVLICHSHHSPKSQGELQDMGATWARQGCVVLVMDQLGHGERRQHPFVDEKAYPKTFRVGRQDYYFRYNAGLQLALIGDGQIGWMVWDLQRGLDVLLARPGVDKERIALLGAVAGGGDPAAVTAALDRRIKVAAPFNFGGPQPETKYPLPDDAEKAFNYAGGGSWESTRNLRGSMSGGFFPWLIVGSAAPRGLIYGHEFAWDRERDPVWKRLQTLYGWYDVADRLDSVHGRGAVTGQPPDSTHCTNIGPEHRKMIYPALKRWFDLPVPEAEAGAKERHTAADLTCWTPDLVKELKPRSAAELAGELADERLAAARRRLADLPPEKRRARLAHDWAALLGQVKPAGEVKVSDQKKEDLDGVKVERLVLHVERDIRVPLLLFVPKADRPPVVIALCQEGKQRFLKERSAAVAALLRKGVAVCLPDVRGTGETRPGTGRGREGSATSLSASEQMLGGTMLGARLTDLAAVLDHLAGRSDVDGKRAALWGESFAPANAADAEIAVPLDLDQPPQAEPLGALLALFGALQHERVQAVAARGGLVSYRSLLDSPFLHAPHDAVVPGALTVGDVADVIAVLAPLPVRVEGPVDGLNRRVSADVLTRALAPARKAYTDAKEAERLAAAVELTPDDKLAEWLAERLRK